MDDANVNLWGSPAHALEYLARADAMPHRCEGEGELLEWLPRPLVRVLDLGSGDGRLLALIKLARPDGEAVALDFSATMIDRLRERFTADSSVRIVEHDLNSPLPASLGAFDAVVSSLAIHHLPHARKRTLFAEVYRLLAPSGVFCNLEHVDSPTARLHQRYLATLGRVEDPSNKLLDLETQLAWLRAIGFVDVDCHWKWRELALLVGCETRSGMRLFALDGVVKSDRSRLRVVSENLTRGGTMAKKVAAKKATAKESAKQLSAKQVSKAAQVLATARTGLVLTGRIKDGKVVFDQTTLDEVAKKFPKGDVAFIAMNAPFDPKAEPALV